jgi:hypothetical protein
VLNRITLPGSLFLAAIPLTPLVNGVDIRQFRSAVRRYSSRLVALEP